MRALTISLAVLLCVAADSDKELAKKDLAAFQGEWSMVSGERDGEQIPVEFLQGFKRVSKGDVTTVTNNGEVFMKAKITLDPTKKPKSIDYAVLDGPNKDKKQLGIYELKGDRLKFCFAAPDKERPTEFASKGEGTILSEWKRDKK